MIETYQFKLGAALKMEQTIADLLVEHVEAARSEQVKELLRRHQEETREHIEVLEQVFGVFEWEVDESPCPAIEGLEKEAKTMIKQADDSLVDAVILQSAVEVEHHELGVYTNLIVSARALGRQDAIDLLEQNRRSEEQALRKATSEQQQVLAAVSAS